MKIRKFSDLAKFMLWGVIFTMPLVGFPQNQDEKFITPLSAKEVSLQHAQSKKFENIKGNKLHKSAQYVKIGNLSKIAYSNKGAIPVQIPGINESFVARPTDVEFSSDADFIWDGEFIGAEGSLAIICKKGEIFGHINLDGRVFEIHSFEKGKNILIEFDNEQLSKHTCAYLDAAKIETKTEEKAVTVTTRSTVRVLVLYTDAANNAVANIHNTASLAVTQMNDALTNSAVNSNLYMLLAGVERIAFTENRKDIKADVANLSTNLTVQGLRNTHQADLVVLLTDGNYQLSHHGQLYDVYGIVADIGPTAAKAYAIVEADQATPKYVFAHEVGHLFGGRHHNDPTGTYQHGYHFTTGWWFWKKDRTTIMYANPGDYILHYSNPDVEYKNKRTGTTSTNDVARKLRTEASVVENFRPYAPPLSVYISGPSKGTNSGSYTWTASVSSGVSPYSYAWHYSLDGYSYYGMLGATSSITAPLPLDNDLFLRVTVTSSDGQTAVDYHTTINIDSGFGDQINPKVPLLTSVTDTAKRTGTGINPLKSPDPKDEEEASFEIPLKISIFPNPIAESSTISYFVNEEGIVSLTILDINGRIVKNLVNGKQGKGLHSINVSAQDLISGTYICQLVCDNKRITQKLIAK